MLGFVLLSYVCVTVGSQTEDKCVCVPDNPCETKVTLETKVQSDKQTNTAIVERIGMCSTNFSCLIIPKNNDIYKCGVPIQDSTIRLDIHVAQTEDNPWLVAIQALEEDNGIMKNNFKSFGSLIHPSVVMTTKHSLYDDNRIDPKHLEVISHIRSASVNEDKEEIELRCTINQQRRKVKKIIENGPYKRSNHNDIALLILEVPFFVNENVSTICLPTKRPPIGPKYEVANWYTVTDQKNVVHINMPVWEDEKCQKALRKTRLSKYFLLHDSFICVGGENGTGTDVGDAGSPLKHVIKNVTYAGGMISWGLDGKMANVPELFVDVFRMTPWIKISLQAEGITIK